MQPEERLDALLSQRHAGDTQPAWEAAPVAPRAEHTDTDTGADPLEPLLGVADQFAVWGTAVPLPAFAARLESELLARFAVETADGHPAPIPSLSPRQGRRAMARTARWLKQPLAAALVLLALTGAVAAAALGARSGHSGSGITAVPRTTRTPITNSTAARARQDLQAAQQALDAFDNVVAHRTGDASARQALAAFAQNTQAAATDLANLPVGDEHAALAARLSALTTQAEHDLRVALITSDWPMRAAVTLVLGQLGVQVPRTAQAAIAGTTLDGSYVWIITINGTGFAPDAVVLIDGQPLGTVVSRSSTTLTAQLPGTQLNTGSHTVGVGNPDDTASIVTNIASGGVPDDHGGSGGGGGGGGGSGSDGGGTSGG